MVQQIIIEQHDIQIIYKKKHTQLSKIVNHHNDNDIITSQ